MDPYGFPDRPPERVADRPPEAWAGSGTLGPQAHLALWSGVGAALALALGSCTCGASYLLALPLSLVAVVAGLRGVNQGAGADRQVSAAGLLTGIVTLAPTVMFMLFAIAYAGIIAFAVIAEGVKGL